MLPFGVYQHDITFPSITGEFQTATLNDQQPIRQISAGFHLNPPPPLPFLQSFPLSPQFLLAARNSFKTGNLARDRFLGAPLHNLFTPNTERRQRPESDGQQEEYVKYLKEEAEDLEKEKQQNDITTDFTDFSIEATSVQPNQKTFVRVNVQGKNYSYST